jgi:hypothetical protein
MKDLPAAVLTATIWLYWLCVGVMIVRIRRKTRKQAGVIPRQRLERLMWLVWVPLVAAWVTLPYLAATRSVPPWAIPDFARNPPWIAFRWMAALIASLPWAVDRCRCAWGRGGAWRSSRESGPSL